MPPSQKEFPKITVALTINSDLFTIITKHLTVEQQKVLQQESELFYDRLQNRFR